MPAPASRFKGQADADRQDAGGRGERPSKKITFQLYAKGAETYRQAMDRGHGTDLQMGYPQMNFKVRPGLNTFKQVAS